MPNKRPKKSKFKVRKDSSLDFLKRALQGTGDLRLILDYNNLRFMFGDNDEDDEEYGDGIYLEDRDFFFEYEKEFKEELKNRIKITKKIVVFKAVEFLEVEVPAPVKKIKPLKS